MIYIRFVYNFWLEVEERVIKGKDVFSFIFLNVRYRYDKIYWENM